MPRTPRVNVGTAPVTGSVGRLRVDAPTDAFGSGTGMSRAGAGLQNLGVGLQQMGEAQDRRAKQAEAEAAQLQVAEAKKQLAARKIAKDQAVLEYKMQRQEDVANLKTSKGLTATDAVEQYDESGAKLRGKMLDGMDAAQRQEFEQAMRESDLTNRKSLFEHEGSEVSKAALEARRAKKGELAARMVARRDNLRTNGDDMMRWVSQFMEDSNDAFRGEKMMFGDKVGGQAQKDFLKLNVESAIRGVINDMSTSTMPDSEMARVDNLIGQYAMMFDTDGKELQDAAKTQRRIWDKEFEERQEKQVRAEDEFFMDEFANATPSERQLLADKLTLAHPDKSGRIKTIFNKMKVPTSPIDEKAWMDKLVDMDDVEAYKQELNNELHNKDGRIRWDSYKPLLEAADGKFTKQKQRAWSDISLRLDMIVGGADIGFGEKKVKGVPGKWAGGHEKLTKEQVDLWKSLKDLALDPNVSLKEMNDISEKLFFKPEADIARKKVIDRIYSGEAMFRKASILPGTQDFTGGFSALQSRSDEELMQELNDLINQEAEKQRGKKRAVTPNIGEAVKEDGIYVFPNAK